MKTRRRNPALLLLVVFLLLNAPAQRFAAQATSPAVVALDSVGLTVSNMERSVDFFSRVLSFEKVSDIEVAGVEYERLQGLFGLRARIVRMKLGDEFIELTEYLTPKGRPIPKIGGHATMRVGEPFRLADELPDGLDRKAQKTASTDLIMHRIAALLDERHRGPYAT